MAEASVPTPLLGPGFFNSGMLRKPRLNAINSSKSILLCEGGAGPVLWNKLFVRIQRIGFARFERLEDLLADALSGLAQLAEAVCSNPADHPAHLQGQARVHLLQARPAPHHQIPDGR